MDDPSQKAREVPLKASSESRSQHLSLYEFGGSEEHVRSIQKCFLSHFRSCERVLDLGSGRGIFLELLRDGGIESVGVDSAREAIDACRAKGIFSVAQDDMMSFLADKEQQYDGIFCSHVIEHLQYDDGLRLFRLCFDALQSNGKLVVVTPNCNDLQVLGEIFWLDPTHVRFYPCTLLKRMAVLAGFVGIEGGSILGSWRAIRKRELPFYFLRRLLLGRYYGKPNSFVVARKPPADAPFQES